jgi:hypothetical protein
LQQRESIGEVTIENQIMYNADGMIFRSIIST